MSQRNAVATPASGLLIYQTDNTAGFYFYNGSTWLSLANSLSGWGTMGNAGTTPGTNFLGTMDDQPLAFKLNNTNAGKWDHQKANYFIGLNAGSAISTGTTNIGIGTNALSANNSGGGNTAIGYSSMKSNTSGAYNVAIGPQVLYSNTGGNFNSGGGSQSLYTNTTGSSNTAWGNQSLQFNTTGSNNTAIGSRALTANTIGSSNTAIGSNSLRSNIDGYSNVAIGASALYKNISADKTIAIGDSALYNNLGGTYLYVDAVSNVAVGSKALFSNTTGSSNVAVGQNASHDHTTGSRNVAIGNSALEKNLTGNSSVAIGFEAANINTMGGATSIGAYSMLYSKGDLNTAVGNQALLQNGNGSGNTAVGYRAGCERDHFDFGTDGPIMDYNNTIAIGWEAYVTADNQAVIGDHFINTIGGYAPWSVISDKRFKKEIKHNVHGLDFIMKLQPVTYSMDIQKLDDFINGNNTMAKKADWEEKAIKEKEAIVYSGFEAQEVEKVANEIGYNFSGVIKPKSKFDHYRVAYSEFVPAIVQSLQELKNANDLLQRENEDLKIQYTALLNRIEILEHK